MADNRSYLRAALRYGLISGGVVLAISTIGMLALFAERRLIGDVLTLAHLMLFLAPAVAGYLASQTAGGRIGKSLVGGVVAGLTAAIPLLILIAVVQAVDLRQYLVNVSPRLIDLLTFGRPGEIIGSVILLLSFGAVGLAAAGFRDIPETIRRPLLTALIWTFGVGLLSEILSSRFRDWFGTPVSRVVFDRASLRLIPSVIIFLLAFGISRYRGRRVVESDAEIDQSASVDPNGKVNWRGMAAVSVVLLLLPVLLGTYLSEVVDNIGIYVLMGLGLNIVVGFAGLLDLGYVAFFAIGAYVMAILTSEGSLGIFGLSFWAALPIAVLAAVMAGILLGIPVLRMRGDYLAIVTLGFGEIIRILALSDLLKPYIGGAQGVLQIPKPYFFGIRMFQPEHIYYIILAGAGLAWFVSWRLSEARLGRQWKALREDEDVAEAMGIRLVTTKLLAFGIGAGFSGLAGAIFAPKLTSIFPHSFSLLISINVLSLIIVGGIGSLPGVVVGALVLVGLPELLREFDEYRYLMYGALLIVMMLAKPEGFWPSQIRRRELHHHEEEFPAAEDDKIVEGVRSA